MLSLQVGKAGKASCRANYFCPWLLHSRQNAFCLVVRSGLNDEIEHSGWLLKTVCAGGANNTKMVTTLAVIPNISKGIQVLMSAP